MGHCTFTYQDTSSLDTISYWKTCKISLETTKHKTTKIQANIMHKDDIDSAVDTLNHLALIILYFASI